jgi:DnaJ-class molecular chaperone
MDTHDENEHSEEKIIAKKKKKEKAFVPASHNMERFMEQPSEIECPKCNKSGWIGNEKCDKCDGYGVFPLTITQRMHLFYKDCYIDREKGELVYYN